MFGRRSSSPLVCLEHAHRFVCGRRGGVKESPPLSSPAGHCDMIIISLRLSHFAQNKVDTNTQQWLLHGGEGGEGERLNASALNLSLVTTTITT